MFKDSNAREKFKWFVDKYKCETGFETGTHLGIGAVNMSEYFKHTITCEVKDEFFTKSCNRFLSEGFKEISSSNVNNIKYKRYESGDKSIWIFYGSSELVMKEVLSGNIGFDFPKPYLFYLDAHWDTGGHDWPVQEELNLIAKFGLSDSKIIIHDFKVPGYSADKFMGRASGAWGFDSYGGQDLDYDFVKNYLWDINPKMLTFFPDKVLDSHAGRGILYAVPPEEQDFDEYLEFNRGKPPIKLNPKFYKESE